MTDSLSLGGQRLRVVVTAMMAPVVLALVAWWVWAAPGNPATSPLDALQLALHWLLVPGICLLAGIVTVANQRFLSEAIDGRVEHVPHRIEIMLRYNRNTLEQVVLLAIAWLGLAFAQPAFAERLFPALAIVFAVGRAAFLAGYLYAPWARAFGFGLSAYPTLIAYGWLATQLW